MTALRRDQTSRQATWAGIPFYVEGIKDEAYQQSASRVAQGQEGQRVDTMGINIHYWTDFSGGMVRRAGIHPPTDLNQVYYSQGLQTHVPYQLTLPYLLTTQATLNAADFSGFRAANKRVHSIMTSAGVSGQRFIAAIGTKIFQDTSTTDPALTLGSTKTDSILSIANLRLNAVDYTVISTDGTTDDTVGMSDISSGFVTSLVTHAHADDGFFAMQFFPEFQHNVFVGVLNQVNGIWSYPASAVSLPLTISTMLPVVYKDTKDVENTAAATVTTSAISPAVGALGEKGDNTIPPQGGASAAYSLWESWQNASNILSSNDAYATNVSRFYASADVSTGFITAPSLTYSDELVASGFDFSAVPKGAIITGITLEVEAHESSAGDQIFWNEVRLKLNGGALGVNMADGTEVTSSTNTYKTFGGSTIRWGTSDLKGAEVQTGLAVSLIFVAAEGASVGAGPATSDVTGQINVDHVRITLTYRIPGTQVSLKKGGYTPGPWLSRPNTLVYIEPEANEETTVFKSRKLCFINLEYDPEGDRVVASLEYPDTGLSYIEAIWPGLGGWFVAGDKSSGLGKQVKHVNTQGVVSNYNFPGFHGTAAVGVVNGFDEGISSLVEVANEDGTETQWWRLLDGMWHACTPLQSKSNAIASLPLAWAETTLSRFQQRVYRFFPVSTTHLAAARTFTPRNPLNDVMSNNLAEPKQDGPLYLITPEFELVNFENENSLVVIKAGSAQLTATSGANGTETIDFEVRTDSASIDLTFASPDVTTGALDAAFEEYKVPSGGKAFRTIQGRVTLDNARSSSVKTPNGLPFETEVVSKRAHQPVYRVFVTPDPTWNSNTDWLNFVATLRTASASIPTQAFKCSGINDLAVLDNWSGDWKPEDMSQPFKNPADTRKGPAVPWLLLRTVKGTV